MKNTTLLRTRNDFNDFTNHLKNLCKIENVMCYTRDNRIVEVTYTYHSDGSFFHCPQWRRSWNNDGSSLTHSGLDLIEIVDDKGYRI